jgi:hypothetical protein
VKVANPLAYYDIAKVTAIKRFIELTPGSKQIQNKIKVEWNPYSHVVPELKISMKLVKKRDTVLYD